MYILTATKNDTPEEKHTQYVLRSALEEYIVDVFHDTATIQHRALGTYNFTTEDGGELKPERAMQILEGLVKHLHAKAELVNFSDYRPYTDIGNQKVSK